MPGLLTSSLKAVFFDKIKEYVVPESLDGKWEDFRVPNGDKGLLAARIWRNGTDISKCVFLVHPYHKDAKDYFVSSGHPEFYHGMGYHVILFDLNGFGQSDDHGFEFEADIIKVVDYVGKHLHSKINIGHGISFGAAMLLKSLSHNHNIDKAIIENCLDETPNYFKKRNLFLYYLMKSIFFLAPKWKKSNQYFESIKTIKGLDQLCLIYNTGDDLTTPSMGQKLARNARVNIEFHLLKGNHMQGINADPDIYRKIIKSYTTG